MNRNHALFVCISLVCISIGAAAFYYGKVPPMMPTHWDINGNVNGYTPKVWGVSIWPIILAGLCATLIVLPKISPGSFSLERSISTFNVLTVAICVFVFAAGMIALQAATGAQTHMQNVIPGLIGLLFIVLGNYMGKLRKNFFIGIRTPWTLASDEVWARTHRLGGWVFILGGLALIVEAVLGVNQTVVAIVIAFVVIVPIAYSFFLYKRIEGFGPDNSPSSESSS